MAAHGVDITAFGFEFKFHCSIHLWKRDVMFPVTFPKWLEMWQFSDVY